MKVMSIGSELIRIVYVHTEYALTAIRIKFAFSQSTSIWSQFEGELHHDVI